MMIHNKLYFFTILKLKVTPLIIQEGILALFNAKMLKNNSDQMLLPHFCQKENVLKHLQIQGALNYCSLHRGRSERLIELF
jgi:hypothetical protein